MATFSTDVNQEPTYINFIDIGAGYAVLPVAVDGLFDGDQVQMATLEITPAAGGSPVIVKQVDLQQRTAGFFEYITQLSITAHFSLSAADIALIAAGSFNYSVSVSVLRNDVSTTREVQAGVIAARTGASTPPLIVAAVVVSGGPVTGAIGTTAQLTAVAYDGLGNAIPAASIVWSSSDPLLASVDQSGLVSFVLPGTATIMATSQGIEDHTLATANDPNFVSPTNKQVAGYLTGDASWRPRSLDASWIAPGTFAGNIAHDPYIFPDGVEASSFAGDGFGLTDLQAAQLTGAVAVAHGGTGVASLAAGNLPLGAGTSPMTALAPGAAGGFVRSNGSAWARALPVAADISDLTTTATGITKVGTVDTGVWHGSSIGTAYTDAKLATLTGVASRTTVSGTATDPIIDIAAAYAGQASITTVGTIATGVWAGTSIAVGFTDAKVVSISGVSNRTTVTGTQTVPIIDISATYVGQSSITTLGTVTTGVWHGTVIGTTYTTAQLVTLTGTAGRITISGTATDPIADISTGYIGQGSITTVGTIAFGVWAGTSISTTYTDAKIKTVTGTSNRLSIGGTATDPTFDISAAYVGQASITTLGTVATGTWHGSVIAATYTQAQLATLTGTTNRITIGGTATDPTVDVSATYAGQNTITTLGTVVTGVWQGTSIATGFTDAKIKTVTGTSNRLAVTGTATDPIFNIDSAYVGQSTITTLGTVTTGTWAGTTIAPTAGGTGIATYTLGDLLYSSAGNTLAKLAGSTSATKMWLGQTGTGAVSAAPAWSQIVTADISDLASATTGITKLGTINTGVWHGSILDLAYGGTTFSTYAQGDILYADAANSLAKLTIGAANRVMTSSGTAPQWSANIVFAALPTGNGAWDTGAGTTVTLTRSLTVGGNLSVTGNVVVTGSLTGTLTGSISGNAATATALATARAINGINFDGTAPITITAAAGTLTGSSLAAGVTGSSLTSLGTQAHDLLFTDGLYDIGKSGATRPRNAFFTGTVSAKLLDSGGAVINAAIYGVVADAKNVTDGAIASGTPNLSSASALFSAADVGKTVTVGGAGTAGATLTTTILAYVSATEVTLAANASTTVTGANVNWGTENSTALGLFKNAVGHSNGLLGGGAHGVLPAGRIKTTGSISLTQSCYHITGAGNQETVIDCQGVAAGCFVSAVIDEHKLQFEHFFIQGDDDTGPGIDTSACTGWVYLSEFNKLQIDTGEQAMYMPRVFNTVFRNVIGTSRNNHTFQIYCGPGTVWIAPWAFACGSAKAGFRLAGDITLLNASGVAGPGSGDYPYVFGNDTTDAFWNDFDATSYPVIEMINCDIENWGVTGVTVVSPYVKCRISGGEVSRSSSSAFHSFLRTKKGSYTGGVENGGFVELDHVHYIAGGSPTASLLYCDVNDQVLIKGPKIYNGFVGFYDVSYAGVVPAMRLTGVNDVYGDSALDISAAKIRRLSAEVIRYEELIPATGTTAPDVTGYTYVRTANAGSTTITSFPFNVTAAYVGGVSYDRFRNGLLIVQVEDNNTTFTHNYGDVFGMRLLSGANYTAAKGEVLFFVYSEFYTVSPQRKGWIQVGLSTANLMLSGKFGCNGATAQASYSLGGAAPAGGTGATAGAFDTAAHRDALITLVNNMRTALINCGIGVA